MHLSAFVIDNGMRMFRWGLSGGDTLGKMRAHAELRLHQLPQRRYPLGSIGCSVCSINDDAVLRA